MFEFDNANIEKIVIHIVGNKSREEGIIASDKEIELDNEITKGLISKYFFGSLKGELIYHFGEYDTNPVYDWVKTIFDDKDQLYPQSINILEHLYENSIKGSVKMGELFVAYISDCVFEGQITDAIGIFRTEKKDYFLNVVEHSSREFAIDYSMGVNANKLDKGCLIFNVAEDDGYRIALVDKTNTKNESYWRDSFLAAKVFNNEFVKTKAMIEICEAFAGVIHDDNAKSRAILLNNSISYFDEHHEFDVEEFSNEVIESEHDIANFKEFVVKDSRYYNRIEEMDNFDISSNAVKAMRSKIKNLIKLDTDIEIKINTQDNEYVEKGFDQDKQMSYYKVYFNDEK